MEESTAQEIVAALGRITEALGEISAKLTELGVALGNRPGAESQQPKLSKRDY